MDGGQTFTTPITGMNFFQTPNPFNPSITNGMSDPHVIFDKFGNLYLVYLYFEFVGGNLFAGLNIAASTDGGVSFVRFWNLPQFSRIPGGPANITGFFDYPWIVTGPDSYGN
jgi:hypothetical protein